jgi:hypothetical protein
MMTGGFSDTSAAQMERLQRAMDRNARTLDRTPAEGFRQLVRKRVSKCGIAPFDLNDEDGFCTGNEVCLEVTDDDIGDNDGMCETKGALSKREVCVEVCEEEGVTDPRDFDDEPGDLTSRAADIGEELEDLTEGFDEITEMLDQEMQLRAASRALALDDDASACEIAANLIKMRALNRRTIVLIGVAEGVNVAEQSCDELSPDNPATGAICVAVAVGAGVAQTILDIHEANQGNIDSDTMDATLLCVKDLTEASGDIVTLLGAINDQLTTIQEQSDTTIRLLNTPQGRREGFPEN